MYKKEDLALNIPANQPKLPQGLYPCLKKCNAPEIENKTSHRFKPKTK